MEGDGRCGNTIVGRAPAEAGPLKEWRCISELNVVNKDRKGGGSDRGLRECIGGTTQGGRPTARRVGVRSSDSGDIREGRERGEGKRNPVEWVRWERGERGEAAAAAEAASRRSSGVTFSGADLPGLFRRYVALLC